MKIVIAVFLALLLQLVASADGVQQAFLQLEDVDSDRTKLNWKVLSEALNQMLDSVQNAREIEKNNQENKQAVLQKFVKLQERTQSQIKLDLAKGNDRIQTTLQPYKLELEEAIQYKGKILEQQNQDLKINEDDRNEQKKAGKQEMDEVSAAIQNIDKLQMLKSLNEQLNPGRNGNQVSLAQVKQSMVDLHQQISTIAGKGQLDSPIMTMTASLAELLQLDFKERKVLKDMENLLDELRSSTIDYRIELINQNKKNQQLYEQRKETIDSDKSTNLELHQSKLEQYDQVSGIQSQKFNYSAIDQINTLQKYLDSRNEDLTFSDDSLSFFKNMWALNEGIQNNLEKRLMQKAVGINDALKTLGEGIDFKGERLD